MRFAFDFVIFRLEGGGSDKMGEMKLRVEALMDRMFKWRYQKPQRKGSKRLFVIHPEINQSFDEV